MEKLLDEVSFDAPDLAGKVVTIDEAYVDRMLADIVRTKTCRATSCDERPTTLPRHRSPSLLGTRVVRH